MHLHFPLALLLALPSPVVAAATPTSSMETSSKLVVLADAPVPASVAVEVVGYDAEATESKALRNQALEAIASEGVTESQNPKDPQVQVKITALGEYKDEGFDIEINATGDSKSLLSAPITAKCEYCTEGELAAMIRKEFQPVQPELAKYIEARDKAEAEAAAAAAAENANNNGQTDPNNGQTTDPNNGQPPTTDNPEGMTTTGKAGAALMVVGGIGMAVGLGLAVNPPRQPNQDIGYELVSTRPPGYAMLGIGGAALITGVALFVVDRNRRKKNTAIAPVLGPGVAGLSWSGRF